MFLSEEDRGWIEDWGLRFELEDSGLRIEECPED